MLKSLNEQIIIIKMQDVFSRKCVPRLEGD